MNEREWLASADPGAMLEAARGKVSDRKLRLFACAAWRDRVSRFRPGPGRNRSFSVASIAEQFADGEPPPADRPRPAFGGVGDDFAPLLPSATEAARSMAYTNQPEEARQLAHLLRDIVGTPHRPVTLEYRYDPCPRCGSKGWHGPKADDDDTVWCRECRKPRSLGRLYCPWLTATVVGLAQAAYDARDPETGHLDPLALAAVADALEEAGCDSEPLLAHLRDRPCPCSFLHPPHDSCDGSAFRPKTHVRGCWAIDLLTGRE